MSTNEQRRYRFGPLERRGLIGSLRPAQVGVIAICLVVGVILMRALTGGLGLGVAFLIALLAVAFCFWLMQRLIASPLGKALVAIRDNDVRASLIGLNVYLLRLIAFVMAGFLAGVAGALFAFFGRYASASYMFYHVSGEAVVWAIVGGAGTLLGPVVGTTIFIIVREVVSTHWEHHSLIVGAVAILVVIFAPKGVVGLWNDWIARLAERSSAGESRAGSGQTKLRTDP